MGIFIYIYIVLYDLLLSLRKFVHYLIIDIIVSVMLHTYTDTRLYNAAF